MKANFYFFVSYIGVKHNSDAILYCNAFFDSNTPFFSTIKVEKLLCDKEGFKNAVINNFIQVSEDMARENNVING